jgi:class 3 adenylate cyclase/Tfp pilus assembly protein PilF
MSSDPLLRGREAFERHQWQASFESLLAADQVQSLGAQDLERLAWSARWCGRYDEIAPALERAEREYASSGDRPGAARAALYLAQAYADRGNDAVARGHFARAGRILDEIPECPEHGLHAWMLAFGALRRGENKLAREMVEKALAIGKRLGDADMQALATLSLGHVLLTEGRLEEGIALHDEACARVSAGRLSPYAVGTIYCSVIFACRNRADWQRAHEWTQVVDGWCSRESIGYFPGLCRVHHAEVLRFRGELEEAERDALKALEQLSAALPRRVYWAHRELGEIRLRRGDLEGAEAACARALESGPEPQPLLALIRLERGDAAGAVRSLERALADPLIEYSENRVNLLPVMVSCALAAGLTERARAAMDELVALARRLGTPAPLANAACAEGEFALAEGRLEDAVEALHRARALWTDIGATYDAACAQALLGEALARSGDAGTAVLELRAALATFERLGAGMQKQRIAAKLEALVRPRDSDAASTRAAATFMFTDIVDSTRLLEALGDEAWSNLRNWHDRMLRACFSAHGGEEVDHAGDGFFVAFSSAQAALRCAIAIQRRLATHRSENGFAPEVRIGVHCSEALKSAAGFTGKGVHEAARIAAAGAPGEIIASRSTLSAAGDGFCHSSARVMDLKGLSAPLAVATVEWRQ